MLERDYQSRLIRKIKRLLPGALIMKNDANYIQGIPDLLILYKNKWAALEVKTSCDAKHQPNQDYYVEKLANMSFCSFIFPENEEEILHAMEQSFKGR